MNFIKIIIIVILSQYIFGCVEKTTYSGKIITNDDLDLNILNKKFFNEIDFNTSFELISILLIYYLKFIKNKDIASNKRVKEELMKNLVNDLDKSLRDVGISDMSIGKYVKKYVKKFYYRLKILDPIFENDNNQKLLNYLNSL